MNFIGGSDSFRYFKIISVNNKKVKDVGRYKTKGSPGDAAKKAFTQLSKKYKTNKLTFSIKETTQGSSKKENGPYLGEKIKLKKPLTVKYKGKNGKNKPVMIKYETKIHLVKDRKQKGGMHNKNKIHRLTKLAPDEQAAINALNKFNGDYNKAAIFIMKEREGTGGGGAGGANRIPNNSVKDTVVTTRNNQVRRIPKRIAMKSNFIIDVKKQTGSDGAIHLPFVSNSYDVNIKILKEIYDRVGNIPEQDYISVERKGRKIKDLVKEECPPGFGFASGSKGSGFYRRECHYYPSDIHEDWNYLQEHPEDTDSLQFDSYKREIGHVRELFFDSTNTINNEEYYRKLKDFLAFINFLGFMDVIKYILNLINPAEFLEHQREFLNNTNNKKIYFEEFKENYLISLYLLGDSKLAYFRRHGSFEIENSEIDDRFKEKARQLLLAKYEPLNNETIREAIQLYKNNRDECDRRYGQIEVWDVSGVTDMSELFKGLKVNFNRDIGNWDVSNVTDMREMFIGAIHFNQDISNWEVSAVTDNVRIFHGADSLQEEFKPVFNI